MRILVADPNEAFATLLTEELKREGFEVDMCLNGADALAAAQRHAITLAVLDMALSGPDALTLIRHLRNIDAHMRFMLIPLLGETLPPQATALAVQGVLPKPFFLPELPGLIQAALDAPLGEITSTAEPVEPLPTVPEPQPLSADESGLELELESEPVVSVESREEVHIVPPPRETPPEAEPPSETVGLSYEAYLAHRTEVEQLMNGLVRDVGVSAVLLTFGGGLLTWVGDLAQAEAESIARAIIHGWRTSAEVARILGREQVRFEQSIAGDNYMLYALSIEVNAIMGVVVRGSAPLGLLRHQGRMTAERIAQICKP